MSNYLEFPSPLLLLIAGVTGLSYSPESVHPHDVRLVILLVRPAPRRTVRGLLFTPLAKFSPF